MTCGRFGRSTISPSVLRGSSWSSSSKIRTSKYSWLRTPAASGRFSTPSGVHDTRLASVCPNAPLNTSVPNRSRSCRSISIGIGAAPMSRSVVLASGAPDFGIAGRSSSLASRYAIDPSSDTIVAPVRFISGQKLVTENLPDTAARPPHESAPVRHTEIALKWKSGSADHTTSSGVRRQEIAIWFARPTW